MKKFNFAVNQAVFETRNYAEFCELACKTASHQLPTDISEKEANDKIREIFAEVLGLEEDASRKEIRRAIRRRKDELFEITEDILDELILGGWGDSPFFNEYVELKSANLGDQNVWTVPDSTILTVSEVSGGHHDIIRQRLGSGKTYSVPTKWYAVKVYAEYEHFMSKRIDWAYLVQKVYEAMDYKVNTLAYQAFASADSVIPSQADFVKTGTLTEAKLLELIENVQIANPGKEVRIIGVKSALAALNTLQPTDWAESAKEERHTLGRLGMWEGTGIVELAQVALPGTMTKVLPVKKLWVMPIDPANKMIKVYDEGDAQIKEVSDGNTNMDMTVEYEYQRKMGVGVVFSRYFGTYSFT